MISVVTITYNNYLELKSTLNSLHDLQNIQSVVINGGRDEDSLQLLSHHAGVTVTEPDEGISDAFNKGIRHSTGDAIAFLNSGDILIDREYYIWADRVLAEDPNIAFTFSDIRFIDPIAGEVTMKARGRNDVILGEGMPFPHPSMVVRREIFEKIGGFSKEYKIAMDFEFVTRLIAAGHRGSYYPQATVKMDGSGISTSKELPGILECKKALIAHGLFTGKNEICFESRLRNYRIREWVKRFFGDTALRMLKNLNNRFPRK
jgi:GT2 family glycosyltransferase